MDGSPLHSKGRKQNLIYPFLANKKKKKKQKRQTEMKRDKKRKKEEELSQFYSTGYHSRNNISSFISSPVPIMTR